MSWIWSRVLTTQRGLVTTKVAAPAPEADTTWTKAPFRSTPVLTRPINYLTLRVRNQACFEVLIDCEVDLIGGESVIFEWGLSTAQFGMSAMSVGERPRYKPEAPSSLTIRRTPLMSPVYRKLAFV